jgi:hypothetical protein
MRGIISISEKVADLPIKDGGNAEVCATAEGEYHEQKHELVVTVDSFVRPADPLDPPIPRPEWLPKRQEVKDFIDADEASEQVRDIFERWVERIRHTIPEELEHPAPTGP